MNTRKILASALLILVPASAALAYRSHGRPLLVELEAEADAVNAGLQNATGQALLQEDNGQIRILVDLGGACLPPGTVLEGWVVDAGLLGGPGTTSVSDDDEAFGTPFGNATFDAAVDSAPYALSTGVLERRGHHKYAVTFRIANNFTPYDAVVVTLEADGNGMNYDPRPGSIVVAGPIVR